MGKKISLVILGAGGRGCVYSGIAKKRNDLFEVVAVADPNDSRRNKIKNEHNIKDENCFTDWKDVFARGKMADCVVIGTQDKMHYEPAMKAIELGYDLLLEKPVSPSPEECMEITEAAEKKGVKVVVCHVLRYTPFYSKVKQLLDDGEIGDIMSIQHMECVGYFHQAHSFVRGNWNIKEESSPMILAKCCHDMDLLQWLIGKKCKKVSSFGALTHFNEANKPEGAPKYCIEGCPHSDKCPYDAVKLYYDDKDNVWFRTAATELANPTDEDVKKAITSGPYGRCVYQCDNNVVDHQVVNLEFEGGVTASFTMCAFTPKIARITKISGTKGELNAHMNEDGLMDVSVTKFLTGKTEVYDIVNDYEGHVGHGGGDEGIMISLYELLNGTYTGNAISSIRTSCENHMIAFKAEEARVTNKIVELEDF